MFPSYRIHILRHDFGLSVVVDWGLHDCGEHGAAALGRVVDLDHQLGYSVSQCRQLVRVKYFGRSDLLLLQGLELLLEYQ